MLRNLNRPFVGTLSYSIIIYLQIVGMNEMIGTYIKYMREQAGFSQTELAKKLNIAQTTLSGYETGYSKPNYDIVQEISFICGFDILIKDKHSGDIITINKK